MKLIDILVEETIKNEWSWPKRANCITQDPDKRVEPATCQPGVAKFNPDCGQWFLNSSRIGGFSTNILASDYATAIITREQYEAALAAKNDGWIDWGGGECPVEIGVLVDVKLRNGRTEYVQKAHSVDGYASYPFWRNDNAGGDIISYRLYQPQEAEQAEADDEADLNECIGQGAAPVWSGEGLPPVGCKCEYLDRNNGWYPVTIKYASNQIVVICGMTNILGDKQETEIAKDVQLDKPQFRLLLTKSERKRKEAIEEMTKIATIYTTKSLSLDLALNSIYNAIAAGEITGVKLEN